MCEPRRQTSTTFDNRRNASWRCAAVIHKKGVPENFVWEETKVGAPERGQVRLRSTAVGVNFADTYHRAGIPHPMIVGDPPVVLGFEGVGEIEELGPGVTGFSVGERVCTCLPPLGSYSQERLYPADKLIKVPTDLPLDDVQLAGLILKGMTAQYLLHRTYKVQPGRRSEIAVRCRRTRGRSEQHCQNLPASRGCGRAQVHRRTQDNGFDCHAAIRVSG